MEARPPPFHKLVRNGSLVVKPGDLLRVLFFSELTSKVVGVLVLGVHHHILVVLRVSNASRSPIQGLSS